MKSLLLSVFLLIVVVIFAFTNGKSNLFHTSCECHGVFCKCDVDCPEGTGLVASCECGVISCNCDCVDPENLTTGDYPNNKFPKEVRIDRLEKLSDYFSGRSIQGSINTIISEEINAMILAYQSGNTKIYYENASKAEEHIQSLSTDKMQDLTQFIRNLAYD